MSLITLKPRLEALTPGELRAASRYAFRREPDLAKRFTSRYRRRHRRNGKGGGRAEEVVEEVVEA